MPALTTVVAAAAVVTNKFSESNRCRYPLPRLYNGPMIFPMIIGPFISRSHQTNCPEGV